ncbi:site-specific integrase [Nocardioides bruguierae]|uniref:Site-specific integrase n=1 Tax=Nocardioides bruguierae TaxID=2945102 RepID=A0A9X2DBY0_9ACTN|nr:site-specific integrase [Nocardioides bruguierae]MCM0622865.1 site-specific integrase [Nocardioides bruguierae]
MLDALIKAERQGKRQTPADLNVAKFLNEWLDQIVGHRVRPTTLSTYRHMVTTYLIPGLGKTRLEQLNPRQIRSFYDALRKKQTGARTITYVHATLRAALEDAVREEIIERNPAKLVKVTQPAKKEIRPLDLDEVRRLVAFHREDPYYPMLVLFTTLGLRRSEALGLMWADVDLPGGSLEIRRGLHRIDGELVALPTKTARSQRTIPLPALVVEALTEQRERQAELKKLHGADWQKTGHVLTTGFGTPFDPRNTTRIVQACCRRAGVRVVRLHDFRHGCASLLLGAGVPPRTVMEILGHSSLEMTMNTYGHVTHADRRTAIDGLGEALGASPLE